MRSFPMQLIILSSLFITSAKIVQAQHEFYRRPSTDLSDSLVIKHQHLKEEYSGKKIIPSVIEPQTLYALSYFPELNNTRIKFRLKKSKGGIISTRPTFFSIFKRSTKRTYLVIINDSTEGRALPLFQNAPVNGQIGILGHELNHIIYFNNKSGLGLIALGIKHISKKYMDRFEFATDQRTIAHGLGHQLYSWKEYLEKRFQSMGLIDPGSGKTGKMRKRYMSLEEIKAEMNKSELYR